jgi:hypothetical protein
MSLEDLSTTSKQVIVVLAIIAIIGMKILGFIKTKPSIFLIIGLAVVGIITEPESLNATELPPSTS